jgi:filamentous hemagglutinin family protein
MHRFVCFLMLLAVTIFLPSGYPPLNAAPLNWQWLPGQEPRALTPKSTLSTLPRSVSDRPDEVAGPQVHVMYVLPADGADEQLDINGRIGTSVVAFNLWLLDETPGRWLRIDTYNGLPDITFFRLQETDAQMHAQDPNIRDRIEEELRAHNLIDAGKIYAVYYGGSSSFACGGGSWPPALVGSVGAMYLKGAVPGYLPCASSPLGADLENPGYLDISMLHELMHVQGFVPTCASHATLQGHVGDNNNDLMYAGSLPWMLPPKLDIGRDDYYQAGIAGCLDFDRSPFLTTPGAASLGTAIVSANPYGPLSVFGAVLNGNTISGFQQNVTIQLGNIPGVAGSFLQIDFTGFSVENGRTLTIRSGASGQTVLIRNASATASVLGGLLQAQGGNGAAAPGLYLQDPNGMTINSTSTILAQAGLTIDTLGGTVTSGNKLLNLGWIDGGPSLTLRTGGISGGGGFAGNAITVSTFGDVRNPVNGSHYLANGVQLHPSGGGTVALVLNDYGGSPQFLNLMVNGNASLSMPSAWPTGATLPPNNAPVAAGGVRPAGAGEPSFGGGSMIVQATGNMSLLGGASNDFVFPGAIVLKAGGTLDLNGLTFNQGWTTTGRAFQGVFFESPNIVSAGTASVLSNNLNWTNFSTMPNGHFRLWTLVQKPDGTSQYDPADNVAPHVNTYSVLIEAAANGLCWVCMVNSTPVNVQ